MFPDNFPYTCRIVSDILESNGSSSMATVCGGTLALLDAGVKMKRPVAGVAMGLISDKGAVKYAVLSDILGDEDHLGDMDFKVTGTENGITATQMDIKCDGLSYEILEKALEQARQGRLHILNVIKETIPEAREDYKPHVPASSPSRFRRSLSALLSALRARLFRESRKRPAQLSLSMRMRSSESARWRLLLKTKRASMPPLLKSRLSWLSPRRVRFMTALCVQYSISGAFVEFMPGRDGLLHISEISWNRLDSMDQSGLKRGRQSEGEAH